MRRRIRRRRQTSRALVSHKIIMFPRRGEHTVNRSRITATDYIIAEANQWQSRRARELGIVPMQSSKKHSIVTPTHVVLRNTYGTLAALTYEEEADGTLQFSDAVPATCLPSGADEDELIDAAVDFVQFELGDAFANLEPCRVTRRHVRIGEYVFHVRRNADGETVRLELEEEGQ